MGATGLVGLTAELSATTWRRQLFRSWHGRVPAERPALGLVGLDRIDNRSELGLIGRPLHLKRAHGGNVLAIDVHGDLPWPLMMVAL